MDKPCLKYNLVLYTVCFCLSQRNPTGNPAAAPSAWGGLPAATWQGSAEPHSSGWATTSQVTLRSVYNRHRLQQDIHIVIAFLFSWVKKQHLLESTDAHTTFFCDVTWWYHHVVQLVSCQATQRWAWTKNVYSAGESQGTHGAAGATNDASQGTTDVPFISLTSQHSNTEHR